VRPLELSNEYPEDGFPEGLPDSFDGNDAAVAKRNHFSTGLTNKIQSVKHHGGFLSTRRRPERTRPRYWEYCTLSLWLESGSPQGSVPENSAATKGYKKNEILF
jgi:hypothetical protein